MSYSGTSSIAGYESQDPMETNLSDAGVSILSRVMKAGFETFSAPGSGVERGHSGDGCMSMHELIEETKTTNQRLSLLLLSLAPTLIP